MKIYKSKKAFDVLDLIKKSPERYLSDTNIITLQDFLNGSLIGNPYPDDAPPFWEFDIFLLSESEFKYKNGNKNLISRILLNEYNGDKYQSFNRFFEYTKYF